MALPLASIQFSGDVPASALFTFSPYTGGGMQTAALRESQDPYNIARTVETIRKGGGEATQLTEAGLHHTVETGLSPIGDGLQHVANTGRVGLALGASALWGGNDNQAFDQSVQTQINPQIDPVAWTEQPQQGTSHLREDVSAAISSMKYHYQQLAESMKDTPRGPDVMQTLYGYQPAHELDTGFLNRPICDWACELDKQTQQMTV